MHRNLAFCSAAVFLLLPACGNEGEDVLSVETASITSEAVASDGNCAQEGFYGFSPWIPCNATVDLSAASGDESWLQDLAIAIEAWEGLFAEASITFDSLVAGESALRITITVDDSNFDGGSDAVYCGEGAEGSVLLSVYDPGDANLPKLNDCLQTSNPASVISHELNHALGFGSFVDKEWTDYCVSDLSDFGYSSLPCPTEREIVRSAYNLREPISTTYALVTGLNASSDAVDLSLNPAGSSTIYVTQECEEFVTAGGIHCPYVNFDWTTSDPAVASITPAANSRSAVIRAVGSGRATIAVRAAYPADRLITESASKELTRIVPVTVTAPLLRVDWGVGGSRTKVRTRSADCDYSVGASGGLGPYEYAWSVAGAARVTDLGSGMANLYASLTGTYELRVDVTSADGQSATRTLTIQGASSYPECVAY